MKRYLKPWIEWLLITLTAITFILMMSIDDFTLSFLPIYASMITIVSINLYILNKYGRGLAFEKSEKLQ